MERLYRTRTLCPQCGGTGKRHGSQPMAKRHSCGRCLGLKTVQVPCDACRAYDHYCLHDAPEGGQHETI